MDGTEAIESNGSTRKMTQKIDATQVLIVLSDNGVEEIPFVALEQKHEKLTKKPNVSQLTIFCY